MQQDSIQLLIVERNGKTKYSVSQHFMNGHNLAKINGIKLIKISDFNYQNFIDFPILVKNRAKLNNFLLKNGIESRLYYYKNCEKIFNKNTKSYCSNSQKYENEIMCLPNSKKITLKYIDYIIKIIFIFYSKKNNLL